MIFSFFDASLQFFYGSLDEKNIDIKNHAQGYRVFLGHKLENIGFATPIRIFVTDSTGKKLLWEKLAYTGISSEANMLPMSVVASPDGGFTVVGYESQGATGFDGFVMHFIPKPASQVTGNAKSSELRGFFVKSKTTKEKAIFTLNGLLPSGVLLTVYSLLGRKIADIERSDRISGIKSLEWNFSRMSKGVYLYRLKSERNAVTGRINVE
jgi:hypothetical protein